MEQTNFSRFSGRTKDLVNHPFEHVVCLDKLTKYHPKACVTSAGSASNIVTKSTIESRESVGFKAIMYHVNALSPTMFLLVLHAMIGLLYLYAKKCYLDKTVFQYGIKNK